MPRFFIEPANVFWDGTQEYVRITGNDAHHITHVLRTRLGEHLVACDSDGIVYEGEMTAAGEEVLLRVTETYPADTEPPYKATVYQALVKGDKMETVIQKSVELGAAVIVPVSTGRAVVKLDEKDAKKKIDRWQKIAEEAAKQCGRGIIPAVQLPMSFRDAVKEAAEADLPLFCYEGEGTQPLPTLFRQVDVPQVDVPQVDAPKTVSLFVGPEGGFSTEEVALAKESGMLLCGLGKRILRTETAALFVLSCLSAAYEL